MPDSLRLDVADDVAVLTIDRPERRNAMSYDMWRALPDVLAESRRHGPRCLVVTGAGSDFSAGADIGEFETLRRGEHAAAYSAAVADAVQAIATHDVPTIAAIPGYCVGGGCEIAVACDVRIAGHGARFGITPAKLGLVYSLSSTRRLAALVGAGWARYLLLTASLLDAERAARIGLVHETCPDDAVLSEATQLAHRIAGLAAVSLRGSRTILNWLEEGRTGEDEQTLALYDESYHSAEYAEGVRAFVERRPPRFAGS